ncbi:MAG: hypothetical protein AAFS11_05205 [Planctomycetota bacterium]
MNLSSTTKMTLTALGLGVLSFGVYLAGAGPLNPPAGPVADTSPSLADLSRQTSGLVLPNPSANRVAGMAIPNTNFFDQSVGPFPPDGVDWEDARFDLESRTLRVARRLPPQSSSNRVATVLAPLVGQETTLGRVRFQVFDSEEVGPVVDMFNVSVDSFRIEVSPTASLEIYKFSAASLTVAPNGGS